MDNLNTHWSLDVCRVVARWCHVPFEPHKLKKGYNAEPFSVIQAIVMSFISPRNTARGSIRPNCSLGSWTVAFWPVGVFPASRTLNAAWSAFYKTTMPVAHPYRWTYTGEPLIRDTPFSRTRRQQQHGRACFSPRPKRFEAVVCTSTLSPTGGLTCHGLTKCSTSSVQVPIRVLMAHPEDGTLWMLTEPVRDVPARLIGYRPESHQTLILGAEHGMPSGVPLHDLAFTKQGELVPLAGAHLFKAAYLSLVKACCLSSTFSWHY